MFRSVFGSQVAAKKWFGVLAGRTIAKAGRSNPLTHASRPPVHLAVEQLECRVNPAPLVVASSFFDSAVYEFNSATGALAATLVAPYSSSLLSGPAGLTFGPDGNLYISSQFSNSILQYNLTTNNLSTFISSTALQAIATANGDAQFAPAGLQFGPDGNLYVSLNGGQSASSGGAVVRFDITANAGTLVYNGTSAAIATGLIQPSGLTFGTASGDTSDLYVSNSAMQDVVKVANATSASPTSSTFITSGSGGLNFPAGLTWGPDGELYVADLGATSFQGNVLQFNPDGSFSKVVTPTGMGQPGNLQLQFPSAVLFDGQGHMLTANLGAAYPPNLSGSINQYNTNGTFDQTLVSSSQFPDTGPGTSGISPSELALVPSPAPHLMVAASFFDSAVYEFDPVTGDLTATLVAPYSSSLLSGPAGLALGPDGNLYISSQSNNSILQYNLTTNNLSTFISSTALQAIATANGDAQFAPAGLQFGPDGNLYVSLNGGQSASSGGAVVRFDITANAGTLVYNGTSATIATGLIQPSGLTFGTASGDTSDLYVSNSAEQDVVKVTNATAASPTSGTFITSGSGGLNFPAGLTWGPDGELYVVDLGATSFQGNVLQFNPDGSFSKVVTPTGMGQPGNLQLQFPSAVLFDGQGHMLTANLGATYPPNLGGSINQYNTNGTFDQTLVSSSQFPDTGPGTSGISPSQLALVPAPATHFVITGLSSTSVTAGSAVTFMLTAENSAGETVPDYAGTVQLTSTDGSAVYNGSSLPGSYTFVASDNGSHTFAVTLETAGSRTITVTDQANNSLTGTTSPIAVSTGPFNKYVVSVVGGNTVVAGSSFIVTVQAADQYGNPITSYSGPSSVMATISPTSTASNFPTTVSVNSFGLGFFLGNLQTVGTYTITAANGSFTGSTAPVTVTPGQAVKLAFGVQPVSTPTGVTLPPVTVQVLDVYGNVVTTDNTDSVTLAVASGPGAFTAGSTTTATAHNGVATFSNLTLVNPGSYTLNEVDPAKLTGPSSTAFTVAPLQVLPGSFVGSPSGFSLQFNAPFLVNSTTPVLYGQGFGASAPVPSVTLTGAAAAGTATISGGKVTGVTVTNVGTDYSPGSSLPVTFTGGGGHGATATASTNAEGQVTSVTVVAQGTGYTSTPTVIFPTPSPVEGSVVLNTATNSLTFVETNTASVVNSGTPILPDGTYKVDVRSSGATGLQALNSGGGFLDGLSSGTPGSGDYTTTFTISAAAAGDDVVWVPATADGPGQPLEAPGNNQVGGGYPVYLDDTHGNVTNVQVTVNYNPALLTVTGVTGAGFSLLASSMPGQANLQYSGPALPKGSETPLGFITAKVPSGTAGDPTPYKAKDLLHLSGVSINSGTIPVVTGDALHLVAYVGNAAGSGVYSSSDAVLITRVALETDTGFAAYPLIDPVIVADTDGDGFIPADAPLQANEAGVGFPTFNLPNPPIPNGVVFLPIANNVDPSVSLPSDLHVGADGTLTVPVNIDDADPEGSTGLIAAHLALTYDPRQFSVSAADVHLGSLLAAAGGWTLVPTINAVTGQIAIALTGSAPINTSIAGSLVTIDFHAEPGGVSPRTPAAIDLVASVNPTGQQAVITELEDAQGSFTLTPAPTNGFDPRIDSVVVLTATSSAPISAPLMETAPITATVPLEAQDDDRQSAEAIAAGTSIPDLPATASEASAQGGVAGQNAAADATPVHAGAAVHADLIVIGTSVATFAAAPLTGLVFQVASTSVLSASATTGPAPGPHVTDQLSQLLPRGTINPSDPTLANTVKDVFERLLAGQILPPSAAENLDSLDWDEVGSDLDWQGIDDALALPVRCGRRDVTIYPISAPETVSHVVADRAAVDQYFAQTADASDQIAEDD